MAEGRKIQSESGWCPEESFETGPQRTVEWSLAHKGWVKGVTSGAYQHWMERNYSVCSAAAEPAAKAAGVRP